VAFLFDEYPLWLVLSIKNVAQRIQSFGLLPFASDVVFIAMIYFTAKVGSEETEKLKLV
jgi:hypothetical protein